MKDINIILKEKTVLYAEDEPDTQQQYKYLFESYFKKVVTADNGLEAIEQYRYHQPDILILDINMPILSGLEVSREIRKNDQQTQIILLTSHTDKTFFLEAVELNLTCYLEKPVARKELKIALRKLIDNNPQTKDILLWTAHPQQYKWNTYKQTLFCNDKLVYLTKKETDLLQLFISSDKRRLSYQDIYQGIEDKKIHKKFSENAIKTLLKDLREKLPPDVIKNIYGQGYYLEK